MIEITKEQAEYIIQNGEMPEEILSAGEKIAVVLTQDWCPQWFFMSQWLKSVKQDEVKVYYLCYNKKDYSSQFMNTKETIWKNDLIPYVRYYLDGKFIDDSNFVSKKQFLSYFK